MPKCETLFLLKFQKMVISMGWKNKSVLPWQSLEEITGQSTVDYDKHQVQSSPQAQLGSPCVPGSSPTDRVLQHSLSTCPSSFAVIFVIHLCSSELYFNLIFIKWNSILDLASWVRLQRNSFLAFSAKSNSWAYVLHIYTSPGSAGNDLEKSRRRCVMHNLLTIFPVKIISFFKQISMCRSSVLTVLQWSLTGKVCLYVSD